MLGPTRFRDVSSHIIPARHLQGPSPPIRSHYTCESGPICYSYTRGGHSLNYRHKLPLDSWNVSHGRAAAARANKWSGNRTSTITSSLPANPAVTANAEESNQGTADVGLTILGHTITIQENGSLPENIEEVEPGNAGLTILGHTITIQENLSLSENEESDQENEVIGLSLLGHAVYLEATASLLATEDELQKQAEEANASLLATEEKTEQETEEANASLPAIAEETDQDNKEVNASLPATAEETDQETEDVGLSLLDHAVSNGANASLPATAEETEQETQDVGSSTLSDAASLEANVALPAYVKEDVKEEVQETEDVTMSILKLSLPALGIVLSDPLMSLIDTGCVGQISSIQLAALGPNTLIFNFIFSVFGFLGTTTCNFMASMNERVTSREAQKETTMKVSRVVSQALALAGIIGITTACLMEMYAPQLLLIMGATPDYLKPALTYLRIRALSVPAALLILVGHGASLGRQDAKTPLVINMVAAALNFVGDMVFTLRFSWGIAGAAWATVASQYVAVYFLFKALTRKTQDSTDDPLELFNKDGPSSALSAKLKIGWYGLPSMDVLEQFHKMATALILRCILGMVIFTAIGKVAAQAGTLPLAAHQVAIQVFWFLSFFPEALSVSAQSLIARDVKRNPENARRVARTLLKLSVGCGLILSSLVALIHLYGISWLTSDKTVAGLVASVTKQSMLCEVLCAVAVVIEGIAIASGDLMYLSHMQLVNVAVMLFAIIQARSSNLGLPGVWWCLALSFLTRATYHLFHIISHWHTHILGGAPVKQMA